MKFPSVFFVALIGLSAASPTVPSKLVERQYCECYCGGELYEPTVEGCAYYVGCDGCCDYIVSVPQAKPCNPMLVLGVLTLLEPIVRK